MTTAQTTTLLTSDYSADNYAFNRYRGEIDVREQSKDSYGSALSKARYTGTLIKHSSLTRVYYSSTLLFSRALKRNVIRVDGGRVWLVSVW